MKASVFTEKVENYSRYQHAESVAKAKGLVIKVPGPRELFIDIDSATDFAVFEDNWRRFKKTEDDDADGAPCDYVTSPSPSEEPDHYHVVVTLSRDVKDISERILLQSMLGSDRVREILSWQRMLNGDPVPTLFFEKPPTEPRVESTND